MGRIYQTGRKTRLASKITVYKGFGNCKACGLALDSKEAKTGVCKDCKK